MKYYPCILLTRDELRAANITNIQFNENGRLTDNMTAQAIEDYCGRPVVRIQESGRSPDEILVLAADGYVQYNRLSNKRTVVLQGTFETLKVILQDIFQEHPEIHPYTIFDSYAYQMTVDQQLDLREWVQAEYGRP